MHKECKLLNIKHGNINNLTTKESYVNWYLSKEVKYMTNINVKI